MKFRNFKLAFDKYVAYYLHVTAIVLYTNVNPGFNAVEYSCIPYKFVHCSKINILVVSF